MLCIQTSIIMHKINAEWLFCAQMSTQMRVLRYPAVRTCLLGRHDAGPCTRLPGMNSCVHDVQTSYFHGRCPLHAWAGLLGMCSYARVVQNGCLGTVG